MSAAAAIAEVLRDFALWLTRPDLRISCASKLVEDGATTDDVELVCAFVERSANHDADATGRRLATILVPGKWRDALEAARKHEARKPDPEPAAKRPRDHDHGETRRAEEAAEELRRRERHEGYRAMRVFCRIASDHHDPATVAADENLTPDELEQVFVLGGEICNHPDPESAARELLAGT